VERYKVIFLGLAVAGPEEEVRLIKGLQRKFNLSPEKAESLLQRVPVVIKKGIPKEEMERYVRAFEEIGGRVRAEEEPVSEALGISPEPARETKLERKAYAGPMITCPQCGFEQPEADECVKCGVIISKYFQYQEMARSYEGRVREISAEEKSTPWESGEGFIGAFFQTTRKALFSPTRFFRKVTTGEGYWLPLIYGLICGIIGFGGNILWQRFFFPEWFPLQKISGVPHLFYILIITYPFLVALIILTWSGIVHFCLMIVGGNKRGFQMTFRVISYSCSGYLWGIVPFLGSLIGGIYSLILEIFGLREVHGISRGKAFLAVLLALLLPPVLAGLFIFAVIVIFGGAGLLRGMRV